MIHVLPRSPFVVQIAGFEINAAVIRACSPGDKDLAGTADLLAAMSLNWTRVTHAKIRAGARTLRF